MDETASLPSADDTGDQHWKPPFIRGHRSPTDRYVAGVLGGLGERFHVDPMILRAIAVAAAVGLRDAAALLVPTLYVVGWIIIPPDGEHSLLATANRRRSLQEIVGATIGAILAALVVATPQLWIAGALAGIAWLLLAPRQAPPVAADQPRQSGSLETPDADPTTGPGASAESTTAAQWGRARRGLTEPLRRLRLRPARPRRPRREPALWPLTVGLLTALAIASAAIDRYHDPGLDPAIAINGALLIIGSSLVLSAWKGRAGWPTLLVVPLIPLWVAFSAADIGRFDGQGDRSVWIDGRPEAGAVAIEHGYGDLDIRITEDALPQGTTLSLTTRMTAGRTTIFVPANTPIAIHSRTGIGRVTVEGSTSPWHSDTATVITNSRTRDYPAIDNECFIERYSPRDLQELYREWASYEYSDDPLTLADSAPDFSDPATLDAQNVQEFLDHIVPNLEPQTGPTGLEWTTSLDHTGRRCDLSETGTISIDATIGIGEIHLVRTY